MTKPAERRPAEQRPPEQRPAERQRDGGGDRGAESLRTVLTAFAANLAIAVAKGTAAVFTGSAALWAETLHSLADTGNQVLLFVGLQRSKKKEDRRHPFGYGQERYFWTFLASLGIFLIGGVLSIGEGVLSLLRPEPLTSPWIGIAVLLAAGGFEAYSWRTARRQLADEARQRNRSMVEHLQRASDPSATAVYLEDTAALVGIALALAALLLHLLTGSAVWDAVASICVGLLLIIVAGLLARRSKALLIDASAPEDLLRLIREAVERPDWVAAVRALTAVFVGPSQLLVIAMVEAIPEVANGPAYDLIQRTDRLRRDLLQAPIIAEVTVTVAAPDNRSDDPVEVAG